MQPSTFESKFRTTRAKRPCASGLVEGLEQQLPRSSGD